jgi:hypothetical protein
MRAETFVWESSGLMNVRLIVGASGPGPSP